MAQGIKILHVSGTTGWRGGEQQVVNLIRGLLVQSNQFLLAPRGARLGEECVRLCINTFGYNKLSGFALSGALAIRKFVRDHTVDIIHLHDPYAHLSYCLASSLLGVDIPAFLHRRVDFVTGANFFSRWKYNHPNIKKIICVSDAVRQVLSPVINNKDRLSVVYSGIDIPFYTHSSGNTFSIRKQLQIPHDAIIIGDVAALEPHKDHQTFISVAKRLCNIDERCFFVVAGDGSLKDNLIRTVDSAGLSGRVFFPGFIQDIPSFLHELTVFLHTAEEEGLGTSIIEAMAAGVPVVASSAGGIPEIVEHLETGLLAAVHDDFTLANHCLSILNNEDLKYLLVSNAKIKVNQISLQHMSLEIWKLYIDYLHAKN